MAAAVKTKGISKSSGRANIEQLVKDGRMDGIKNPFDPNPNPEYGPARDLKTGMREGFTPEEYVRLCEKDKETGKRSAPELHDFEVEIVDKHLKTLGTSLEEYKGRKEKLEDMLLRKKDAKKTS